MDKTDIPRLMISAARKSSGKTMVSLGIECHLAGRGVDIRSFKKGPDYIDPMWHKLASGKECYNLDPYLTGSQACLDSFLRNTGEHSLALIEGNHGLHDGMALDGSDSSAGLAGMLKAPVLLVVDSRKTNRGIAALVMGMQMMPPQVNIAGVILNQVRNSRQGEKQKTAIEHFCNVPVLGVIPADEELLIAERHLGLTTVDESSDALKFIQGAAEKVAHYCDMNEISSLFYQAPPIQAVRSVPVHREIEVRARIGVFRDAAFCFYYPDNLGALRDNGAELVFIDSLRVNALPDVDALYLGGGFPESFLDVLSSNRGLLNEVYERVESGMPLYAECGGLIYLCRSASYGGKKYPLAGLLPFDIGFQHSPAGHGYLDLTSITDSAWFRKDVSVRVHEFHYSKPLVPDVPASFQFEVNRGYGITGKHDGVLYRNLFASFAHLHAAVHPGWAEAFVAMASAFREG